MPAPEEAVVLSTGTDWSASLHLPDHELKRRYKEEHPLKDWSEVCEFVQWLRDRAPASRTLSGSVFPDWWPAAAPEPPRGGVWV